MWARLCETFDDTALRDNPDFADGAKRSENRDAVNAAIEAHTVKKSSADWIELFESIGIPCGPIYAIDEMFADEQVQHVNMAHPVSHPTLGDFNVLGQAVELSRYEPRKGMATPERGQHTDDVLGALGYGADEIAALRQRGIV